MKKAIMTHSKFYKFGKHLYEGQTVYIAEIEGKYFAHLSENSIVGFGVNLKDFIYEENNK